MEEAIAFALFAWACVVIGEAWDHRRRPVRQAHRTLGSRIEAWAIRHGWLASAAHSRTYDAIDRELDRRRNEKY